MSTLNKIIKWCSLACFSIAVLTLLQANSGLASTNNRNIDLRYDVSWGALRLAEASSQWKIQDDKVVILGTVKSDGIAALISGFQSASDAEIGFLGNAWQPAFLSLSRVTKSKQISSSVHWSVNGDILSEFQQPPLDTEEVFPISDMQKRNVIDPYSAVMRQLDYISQNHKCDGVYQIYDGLRRFELGFTTVGLTTLEADRPFGFTGNVLQCKVIVMPKGGHRIDSNWQDKPVEDRQGDVYFARFTGNLILPVRIEVKARIGTGIARLDMLQSSIAGVKMGKQ